jgi:hypothetical protein
LQKAGIDFDALRDPWGQPYHASFGIEQRNYTVEIASAGPDGILRGAGKDSYDDARVAKAMIDYLADTVAKMDEALVRNLREQGKYPANDEELRAAFIAGGVEWDNLRDAWGRPLDTVVAEKSQYGDRVHVWVEPGANASQKTQIRPVRGRGPRITRTGDERLRMDLQPLRHSAGPSGGLPVAASGRNKVRVCVPAAIRA